MVMVKQDKARKIAFVMMGSCFVLIILNFFLGWYFAPEKMAERALEEMARDYYENHIYEQIVEPVMTDQEKLKLYSEFGLSPIRLRQLFSFENAKHDQKRELFEKKEYSCDTNESTVKFFPEEPFGRKNYRIVPSLTCQKD